MKAARAPRRPVPARRPAPRARSAPTGLATRLAGRLATRLAICAALAGVAAPAAAQLRAFEFVLDNDQFAFTPPGEERWYTSGGFIRAAFDAPAGSADARLAAAWCRVVFGCDRDARIYRVLSLNQTIHTPGLPASTAAPQPYDRPYAAALTLGADSVVIGPSTRQTLSLRLGAIGPAALGEPVQNGIHRVLGQSPTLGWGWQVRAQPVVQLGWSRLSAFGGAGSGPDVVLRTAVLAGNPVTEAALGAMLRFGRRPSGPTWPGETLGAREPDGWYGFAGLEGRAIARDALIDGRPYGYASRIEREPFAGSAFVGVSFGAFADWRLDFSLALHSVPFASPIEPATMKPQRIGTIGLRWQPAR